MALFEKIRGRPLSFKFVEYATTGFALLLISFMLYVTFFDLKRLPLIRLLFDRETRIEQVAPAGSAVPGSSSSPAPTPVPSPATP
ncbi:MAG: hypothetical protein M5U12_16675 [Verrucomicrobia bacterium]|nr:hypothetical protein [Verrucomicrobiota bacterium]